MKSGEIFFTGLERRKYWTRW